MENIKVNKLRAKIVENNLTVDNFAKALGMSTPTFYRKIDNSIGASDFTRSELIKTRDILGLSIDEIMDIFFGH